MGRLALTLILSLFLTPSAWAQDDIALAKAYYKQGERLLEEGRYKEAIEAYQKGYDLSQKAAFLYNMAVVYIEMEEYSPAYRLLIEYRAQSPTSEWANIDAMLDDIRPKVNLPWVDSQSGEIKSNPTDDTVIETTDNVQPSPLLPESKPTAQAQAQPIVAYGLLGLAGIGAVSGTIFTVQARSAHDSSASLCQSQLCPAEAESFLLRESNMALAADISWVTGALSFGAGALLLSQHTSSMHWTLNHNSLRFHGQF